MPEPGSSAIKALLETHAGLAPAEHCTPSAPVVRLHRAVKAVAISNLMQLDERARNAYDGIDRFVQQVINTDYQRTEQAAADAGQAGTTGDTISKEIELLQREFDALPKYSPEKRQVVHKMALRAEELRLLTQRVERYRKSVDDSLNTIKGLVTALEQFVPRVEALKHCFTRKIWRLRWMAIIGRSLIVLPTITAFLLTVAADRLTNIFETILKAIAQEQHHDIALLLVFAIFVLGLTPLADRYITRYCRENFNETMDALRALLPAVVEVEQELAMREEQINGLQRSYQAKASQPPRNP
jgi:G:T/U-mismatch repair DNA glycosylase